MEGFRTLGVLYQHNCVVNFDFCGNFGVRFILASARVRQCMLVCVFVVSVLE